MLYSYAYVKAVRNQSNHASAEENLSDEHKELLKNMVLILMIILWK